MATYIIPSGVVRWIRASLRAVLAAALFWPNVISAQQDSQQMKACNLVTPAELSAAIGGTVGQPMGTFSPKNSQFHRDGDFWSCERTVGNRKVRIFYDSLPVTEEGKKLAQQEEERRRKEGYQIQRKELNGSRCATTVPPGARAPGQSAGAGTECQRVKGLYHVLVTAEATGISDLIPMEKVAALVEKAASRVPSQ